jgi:hypothetical protein
MPQRGHGLGERKERRLMGRFQLVFRTEAGDRSEIHDSSGSGGVALLDGTILTFGGREWRVTREDFVGHAADTMVRVVCTPVDPTDSDI